MAITTFSFICMRCFAYHMLLRGFLLCSYAVGGPTEVVLGHSGFPSSCLPAAVHQKLMLGGLAAGSQAAAEPKRQRKKELLSTKRSANVEGAHSTVASFKNVLHLGKLPTNDEQSYQASRSYCSSYPHCSLLPQIYPVLEQSWILRILGRKKEMQVEKDLRYLWKVNLLFAGAETIALSFLKFILLCYSVRYFPNANECGKAI